MQNVIRQAKNVIHATKIVIKSKLFALAIWRLKQKMMRRIKSLGRASGQDLLGEMCDYYGLKRAKDADLEQLLHWHTFCSKP